MKKILSLLILTLIYSNYLFAQSYTILDLKGDSLWKAGKNEDAIKKYSEAIAIGTNNKNTLSTTYDMRARCYRNMKNYHQAINDDSYALELNPKNGDASWNRAISYLSNGDYQLSINDYTYTIALLKGEEKNLSELYRARAYNEIKLRQYQKAVGDCDTALLIYPESKYCGNIFEQKGVAHAEDGEFKLAIIDYQKAMTYFMDNKKTLSLLYNNCAINCYFLKEYQTMIANCSKAISLDSSRFSSYYYRGKAYLETGDKISAQKDFKKVLSLDTSKNSVSYIFSLFYLGDSEDAYAAMYEKILKTSNSVDVLSTYYNMACLLSLMNKSSESIVYLKKAIDGGYSKKRPIYDEDFDNVKNSKEFKEILKNNSSN